MIELNTLLHFLQYFTTIFTAIYTIFLYYTTFHTTYYTIIILHTTLIPSCYINTLILYFTHVLLLYTILLDKYNYCWLALFNTRLTDTIPLSALSPILDKYVYCWLAIFIYNIVLIVYCSLVLSVYYR